MHKLLALIATAAVASTLTSAALAQSRSERERPTVNQIMAFDEARIARAKADLRLKKDQESAWGQFESTLRDISKRRAERAVKAMEDDEKRKGEPTPGDRLRERANALRDHSEDLKKIADASDSLFEKLDDGQKRQVNAIIQEYAAREDRRR